jgi:alkylated DNA repair dioxygenase AlkB
MNDQPEIILEPEFYSEHALLFDQLMRVVKWDESMRARKTASCGKPYNYSQMSYTPTELFPCLQTVRDLLVDKFAVPFNNCLLNLYETGENSMGYHADETDNLMPGSGVAIVSLGGERTITFRTMNRAKTADFNLASGSLLYMETDVQHEWEHSIRTQKSARARISLTWRAIQ